MARNHSQSAGVTVTSSSLFQGANLLLQAPQRSQPFFSKLSITLKTVLAQHVPGWALQAQSSLGPSVSSFLWPCCAFSLLLGWESKESSECWAGLCGASRDGCPALSCIWERSRTLSALSELHREHRQSQQWFVFTRFGS